MYVDYHHPTLAILEIVHHTYLKRPPTRDGAGVCFLLGDQNLPAVCNHENTWRVVNRVAVGQGDECWRHIRAVPDGTIIIMFLQTVNKWQLHVHPAPFLGPLPFRSFNLS